MLERFLLKYYTETGYCVYKPVTIHVFLKSLFPFPLPKPIPAPMKLEFSYTTGHQTNWVKQNECWSDEHWCRSSGVLSRWLL